MVAHQVVERRDRRLLTEVTEIHTRILRLALGIEESRAYWEHVDLHVPVSERAHVAFERRWFGAKSLPRARFLVASLAERYDAFPDAFSGRTWALIPARLGRPFRTTWAPIPAHLGGRSGTPGRPFRRTWASVDRGVALGD